MYVQLCSGPLHDAFGVDGASHIQGLRRVGVADPVMLLDEVDKLGRDAVGGPEAKILEGQCCSTMLCCSTVWE